MATIDQHRKAMQHAVRVATADNSPVCDTADEVRRLDAKLHAGLDALIEYLATELARLDRIA